MPEIVTEKAAQIAAALIDSEELVLWGRGETSSSDAGAFIAASIADGFSAVIGTMTTNAAGEAARLKITQNEIGRLRERLKVVPHRYDMAGGQGTPDRPCHLCGLPDRNPIHQFKTGENPQ